MIYETRNYKVEVTTDEMKKMQMSDLNIFSIINKNFNTIEASCENLPLAINTCKAIEDALMEAMGTSSVHNLKAVEKGPYNVTPL